MGAAYLRGDADPGKRVPCSKVGFASRVEAQRALPSVRKPTCGGLRIYRCTVCRLWHHGHARDKNLCKSRRRARTATPN